MFQPISYRSIESTIFVGHYTRSRITVHEMGDGLAARVKAGCLAEVDTRTPSQHSASRPFLVVSLTRLATSNRVDEGPTRGRASLSFGADVMSVVEETCVRLNQY